MINKHDVVREMTNPTAKTEVTVYSKTPCGGCDFTKNWLDEHNISRRRRPGLRGYGSDENAWLYGTPLAIWDSL